MKKFGEMGRWIKVQIRIQKVFGFIVRKSAEGF